MPRTYEELDLNNKLIWNFRDIGHTMRAISEGKGSQKRVLIVLSEVGAITQSDLTQRLGIQPGSASEVLMKLESAGLIQRVPSEKDKRTTVVLLTPEGQSEAEKLGCARVERHARMFAALDETEKATLLGLLERINTDWDEQYRREETDEAAHRRKHRCG